MKFTILNTFVLVSTMAVAMSAQEAQREENQQARVAQGVKSGQMTPGETAKVEKNEGKVNREVKRDRAANGGTLTTVRRPRSPTSKMTKAKLLRKTSINADKQ